MIATLDAPTVSVILTTYNPRRDLLRWTLDSCRRQTLPPDRWELILVDNNSSPALDQREWSAAAGLPLHVVREPQQGQIFARVCGAEAARGDLLVFVDDDNYLSDDYLETAVDIARQHPEIGAFGGIAEGVLERPARTWQPPLFDYLAVRDHGSEPITSSSLEWGPWEPIGAGLVVRRDALAFFQDALQADRAGRLLGRKPTELLSGDDSLIAKSSIRGGYANSYQPRLRLQHFIKSGRLKPHYLRRLIEGYGHSHIKMRAVLGQPAEKVKERAVYSELKKSFRKRVARDGRAGAILWYSHLGRVAEVCGLGQDEALIVVHEVRAHLRRLRRWANRRRSAKTSVPMSECGRRRAEGLLRRAARLLPVPLPGEQLIEDNDSLPDACRLLRQAATLVGTQVRRPAITATPVDGLRTFRDGRQPLFHLGCTPHTTWRFAANRPQRALCVIEANPLVEQLEVEFRFNQQVINSHVFRRTRDIDRVVVPLELAAGENQLTLNYRQGRAKADAPALFIAGFEVFADDERQWPVVPPAARPRRTATPPLLGDVESVNGGTQAGELNRISVVIPCLNSGDTLDRALESLFAQDYDNLEMIVMDGGSTDDSGRIIERYRDRLAVVQQGADGGQVDALNKGFRAATGDVRGWLCADDELLPGCLHAVNQFFRAHPEADVVSGACERVYADGRRETTQPPADAWSQIGMRNPLEQPSTFWRADLQEKVGQIDAGFQLVFDWDLWARFAAAGANLLTTTRVMSRYHFSEQNKTSLAGNLHAQEGLRLIRRYGPLDGLVGDAYRVLYDFDLRGCLDRDASRKSELAQTYGNVRSLLANLIGQRNMDLYNLHFASLQQRGHVWWR